jgi:hypothetical protein
LLISSTDKGGVEAGTGGFFMYGRREFGGVLDGAVTQGVMMSPLVMPAFSAGEPGTSSETVAPTENREFCPAVIGAVTTPRRPCVALPVAMTSWAILIAC